MKTQINIKTRLFSFMLSLLFIFNGINFYVSADEEKTYEGDSLRGWSVGTFWDNGNDSNTLSWELENNQINNAKLTVNYYVPVYEMTQSYPAGTVRFIIPDIGVVKRSGTPFKAITVADNAGSDWECTYDAKNSCYVFTNAVTFPANEPLAGGFTMLWQIKGRNCSTNFSFEENPVFSLRDSTNSSWENTKMTPIKFECSTIRDYYRIHLERQELGYDEYEDETLNKNQYITYKYNTSFILNQKARAADLNTYFVKVSAKDENNPEYAPSDEDMGKILVVYNQINDEGKSERISIPLTQIEDPYTGEMVWGFYRFEDKASDALGSDMFYLSFPKEMADKNSVVESFLAVHYLDEAEDVIYRYGSTGLVSGEILNDKNDGKISNYSYHFDNGNFSSTKTSPYEVYKGVSTTYEGSRPDDSSKQLLSKKIYNNGKVTFTIGGQYVMNASTSSSAKYLTYKTTSSSASGDVSSSDGLNLNTKTQYDMILADDRLTVLKNDGDFRLLESKEYKITRFVGPVDGRNYDYDIYISNVGYDSTAETPAVARMGNPLTHEDSDYRYYGSGNTSKSNVIDFSNISTKDGFGDFTDGVKAIYIKIKGFQGNYKTSFNVDVLFKFDYTDTDVDPAGKITNLGYMRAFKHGEENDVFTIDDSNYDNTSFNNEVIKPLDRASNGKLIYHTMSSIFLRDIETAITSGTEVDSTKRTRAEGDGYKIDITSTGTIRADDAGEDPAELEKFALYVRIPSILTIDPRLSDISISDCSGTDVLGNAVTNEAFEQNVHYRLFDSDNGDRIIAAEFDFSDSPLNITKLTSLKLNIPAVILYNDFRTLSKKSFEVTSYTKLNGTGLGKITTPPKASADDSEDFDGNGIKGEIMAFSNAGKSYATLVESWQDTTEKFVKSSRDETWNYQVSGNSWISETTVNAHSDQLNADANQRSNYQYRVSFDMGLPTSDIYFSDIIETAQETEWQGKLLGLDFTYARIIGLVPTVYYSTKEVPYEETVTDISRAEYSNNLADFTPSDVNEDTWTAPVNNIRTIVVHFDTTQLSGGYIRNQQVYFLMNMQAPEDSSASTNELYGKYAVNEQSVFYTSQTSVNYKRMTLISSTARVKLLPPVVMLTMLKVDEDNKGTLAGAAYTFYTNNEATINATNWNGEVIAENVTSDNLGEIIVDTLPPGIYYYKETIAPLGYELDPTIYEIDLTGNDKTYKTDTEGVYANEYVKTDKKLKGKIIFTKKDADDSSVTGIKGAKYALFDASGISVYTDENNVYQETGGTKTEFTTDDDGKIIITNLPWGNYYLVETQAPTGYEANSAKVWANVSKGATSSEDQAKNGAIVVNVSQEDKEKTAAIKLIKYDRDGVTPLANAWFSLEKKGDKWETVSDDYVKTGSNGVVEVEELKFGTYRFKEINPPVGYEMPTDEDLYSDEIVLNASTVGKTLTVTKTNERILGKASLKKTSDDGLPLSGAVFDLYLQVGEIDNDVNKETNDALIKGHIVTYENGEIQQVEGLDWGKYYFKEISSPSGYDINNSIYAFEISAENASVVVDNIKPVNDRKKGEVILNKIAGNDVQVGEKTYNVNNPIEGAEFALYTADGERVYVKENNGKYTVCDETETGKLYTMTTDTDGKIDVNGISWGAYYFEEVKAPQGFALADKIRFTVNSTSCLSVQELDCEDFPMECLITIDKEIDSKLDVFGTPTFTFKIKQLDTNTNTVIKDYTAMITLTGDSKTGSATVQVPVGNYSVEEVPVIRYKLAKTEYVLDDNKTTVPADKRFIDHVRVDTKEGGEVFNFTLDSEDNQPQKAEVKFTNKLENYSGLSHTDALTNIIPSKTKITGFSIVFKNEYIPCTQEINSDYTIDKKTELIGYINYDDGSTKEMTEDQLDKVLNKTTNAVNENEFILNNGYSQSGQTVGFLAAYTDNDSGKTYKTNFYVTVGPYKVIETQKVIYRNDINNSSFFLVGKKKYSVNTVYYNDDPDNEGKKKAVSGEYIKPETINEKRYLQNWEIVSDDSEINGKKLAPTEEAVADYLAIHYKDGLRELELRAVVGDPVYEFDYKGSVEVFKAPKDGIYYLEGWGAQGGDSVTGRNTNFPTGVTTENFNELIKETEGGRGGYSYGYVYLYEGDEVYVAVGGKGNTKIYNNLLTGDNEIGTNDGGYNGGGNTSSIDHSGFWYNGSGGGATHFAINQNLGELKNYSGEANQSDILLVAGGGGGSAYYLNQSGGKHTGLGGFGGGEIGGSNYDNTSPTSTPNEKTATGGTQTSGGTGIKVNDNAAVINGSFGQGGNGSTHLWGSGGGGGWYGGGSSALQGGGGGSGHVNDGSLITGATIGGNETFFAPDGKQETGHTGNGYARITMISDNQFNLQYSQTVNQFTAPFSGYYKLEGWGAAGGNSLKGGTLPPSNGVFSEDDIQEGGRGGYSEGYVYLTEGQKIYYAVGGMGNNKYYYNFSNTEGHGTGTNIEYGSQDGGFNGGGDSAYFNNAAWSAGSGGGATHFSLALTSGSGDILSAYSGEQSKVLLVAGGGGGSAYYYCKSNDYKYGIGGAGGGIEGQSNYEVSTTNTLNGNNDAGGGKQSAAGSGQLTGSFGSGGGNRSSSWPIGGGGGWYGGGASKLAGGAGGSSYLGTNASIDVINASTIAGNTVDYTTSDGTVMSPEYMPTHPGAIVDGEDGKLKIVGETSADETMIGNRGNGFARVTYIPYTEAIDYTCVEKVQSFTAPVTGIYMLEAWGAQGGSVSANKISENSTIPALEGGHGGYSYGTVYLSAGQTIYIAVGGEGREVISPSGNTSIQGGFNGGGKAISDGTANHSGSGGGATHFAYALESGSGGVLGDYSAESDQSKVLLVAGGGGGSYSSSSIYYYSVGGYGGGQEGGSAVVHYMPYRSDILKTTTYNVYAEGFKIPGGGQEAMTNNGLFVYGAFGKGTDATGSGNTNTHTGVDSGGGGGWYGGAKLCYKQGGGGMAGGGGSGHCNEDELLQSYGYATIGGNEDFKLPDGTIATGNTGDGYARVTFVKAPEVQNFSYTGSVQSFTAPVSGKYILESWGASGGSTDITQGGKGAYTNGILRLSAGETVYVYVGGEGSGNAWSSEHPNNLGGWNGGADSKNDERYITTRIFASGGGATDFRLVKSSKDDGWSGFDSLKSRIMVAAAGGGSMKHNKTGKSANGGSGGALQGFEGVNNNGLTYTGPSYGATQTSGGYGVYQNAELGYLAQIHTGIGQFGYVKPSNQDDNAYTTGGSGYYAGGCARHTSGSSGGSSFISGYSGCNAIDSESTENNIIHTDKPDHYSGKVFTDSVMIDGNSAMIEPNGTTSIGHSGNGYARITILG